MREKLVMLAGKALLCWYLERIARIVEYRIMRRGEIRKSFGDDDIIEYLSYTSKYWAFDGFGNGHVLPNRNGCNLFSISIVEAYCSGCGAVRIPEDDNNTIDVKSEPLVEEDSSNIHLQPEVITIVTLSKIRPSVSAESRPIPPSSEERSNTSVKQPYKLLRS